MLFRASPILANFLLSYSSQNLCSISVTNKWHDLKITDCVNESYLLSFLLSIILYIL